MHSISQIYLPTYLLRRFFYRYERGAVLLVLILALAGPAVGSSMIRDVAFGWQWRAAAGTAGDLPFWLHSNRLGALDRYSANTTLNLYAEYQHRFDFDLDLVIGANLLLRAAEDPVAWLQEGYVQLGYGHFLLWLGRKWEYYGLLHPDLTSGTMDHSQNMRPMPKFMLSTDGFQPIPGTRRVFYYNGTFAHGWMDDSAYRFVDGVLLHQKTLYLRMFTEDAVIVPRVGITHFAQWGGNSPVWGQSPQNLRSLFDVFFMLSSDSKELFEGGELSNVFQNHLGVYDFSGMFNIGRYKFGFSRQFYLEDAPNARFASPWDGLWSAWIHLRPDPRYRWRREKPADWQTEWERGNRPFLTGINYEHVNTLEQLTADPRRGKERYANYYNHWSYLGGWTYHGRVIGNPLYFGKKGFYGVANNKLIAHHVGLQGFAGPFAWRSLATYSRNYGAQRLKRLEDGEVTNNLFGRKDQWYLLLEISSDHLLKRELRHGPPSRRARQPEPAHTILRASNDGNDSSSESGVTISSESSERAGSLPSESRSLFSPERRDLPVWLYPATVKLSLACDFGQLNPTNIGLMITFGWNGNRF